MWTLNFSMLMVLLIAPTLLAERKLEFVQAIWRHGDRAPVDLPYPNDIYTEEYWPRRWGEITNLGMNQLFEMGQYFRSRYGSIISEHFDINQVYFRSSDINRALVSAQAMLAGLYPANGSYEWQAGNIWQPIGVHASIYGEDDLLCRANEINCKKANDAAVASTSAYSVQVNEEYGDMYPFLANWTGIDNFRLMDFVSIFDASKEIIHNFTQQEWMGQKWPNHSNMTTTEISNLIVNRIYINYFGTQETGPYYGGYLLNDFVQRAVQVANGTQKSPSRFLGYSSHDNNVMAFQVALSVQNGLIPPYASIMIMEIYSNTENNVTQFEAELHYRNDTNVPPYKLEFPGCGTPCLVSKLPEIYKYVMIPTKEEVYRRCGNPDAENSNSSNNGRRNNGYSLCIISFFLLCYLS